MKKNPYLSVIIPVYNEQSRLQNIRKIVNFLNKQPFKSEIVVVNDGSDDNTGDLLKKLSKELGIKDISYNKNRGKGFAVKCGMLGAKGEYRLFTDIDLSTPIEEVKKIIPKKNHVMIGSRKISGAKLIVHQPFMREFMGRFFTLLSQIILGVRISDFTCGFKCFSQEAAHAIFSKVTIDRWGFDSEVLFISKKLGYSILEIPVTWVNDPHTKVKFPQDIYRSLTDLLKIRLNNIRGIYNDL